MKFSIIIPVHNARERIDTIINRLKAQTFKDFEAIFVCDACDDGSFEHIAQTYPEAKVIETSYGNDGMARSTGLDVAKGEWVMFIDDDDDWNSDSVLENIVNTMSRNPNVDIIVCSFNWHGIGYTPAIRENGTLWANVWSKIWRREAIGDTRFPNVYPDSDLYFTQAMVDKDLRIGVWDYCFYEYNYMREGSISWKERVTNEQTTEEET